MSLLQWQQLNAQDAAFGTTLADLLKRSRISETTVTQAVEEIIEKVENEENKPIDDFLSGIEENNDK